MNITPYTEYLNKYERDIKNALIEGYIWVLHYIILLYTYIVLAFFGVRSVRLCNELINNKIQPYTGFCNFARAVRLENFKNLFINGVLK